MTGHRLCPPVALDRLRPVARVRVLYADTDKMGIAYHAAYLRYMELGRVELIRGAGLPYTAMESQGLALPLTDIAVRYSSPALYDDRMTIGIALSLVTRVRVHFDYRIVVAAGDRDGLREDVEILTAQTRHACVRVETGKPERMPAAVYELLKACYTG
jgi:acyl-CoA thioester hydrolase